MQLTENWRIEKEGNNFVLYERYENKGLKGEAPKTKYKEKPYYYGVLYQALNSFLDKAIGEELCEDPNDIFEVIHNVVAEIMAAKDFIKEEFSIEVRTTK